MIDRLGVRADASSERLHTLSRRVARAGQADPRRPAGLIQAYYSPEVPREYVETKADLLGLLKEYAARSGGKIRLNLVPTELYSDAAREAEKRFGIEPQRVFTDRPGQADRRPRSSWASRSPRASRRWSSRSSTAACRSSTS